MEEVRTRGVPLPDSPPAAHVVSTTGSRVYAHVFCSWAAILWKSMTRTVMLSRLPRSKASLASTSHPCRESAFTLATLAISVHRVHLINKVLIESKQMQVGEKICQRSSTICIGLTSPPARPPRPRWCVCPRGRRWRGLRSACCGPPR